MKKPDRMDGDCLPGGQHAENLAESSGDKYVGRRESFYSAIRDGTKDGIAKIVVGLIVFGIIVTCLAIGTFFAIGSLFKRGSNS
jgi:hypothetical protein